MNMTNFLKQVVDCFGVSKLTDDSGVKRYYQTEYGRIEGQRLYSEFLRNGRVR